MDPAATLTAASAGSSGRNMAAANQLFAADLEQLFEAVGIPSEASEPAEFDFATVPSNVNSQDITMTQTGQMERKSVTISSLNWLPVISTHPTSGAESTDSLVDESEVTGLVSPAPNTEEPVSTDVPVSVSQPVAPADLQVPVAVPPRAPLQAAASPDDTEPVAAPDTTTVAAPTAEVPQPQTMTTVPAQATVPGQASASPPQHQAERSRTDATPLAGNSEHAELAAAPDAQSEEAEPGAIQPSAPPTPDRPDVPSQTTRPTARKSARDAQATRNDLPSMASFWSVPNQQTAAMSAVANNPEPTSIAPQGRPAADAALTAEFKLAADYTPVSPQAQSTRPSQPAGADTGNWLRFEPQSAGESTAAPFAAPPRNQPQIPATWTLTEVVESGAAPASSTPAPAPDTPVQAIPVTAAKHPQTQQSAQAPEMPAAQPEPQRQVPQQAAVEQPAATAGARGEAALSGVIRPQRSRQTTSSVEHAASASVSQGPAARDLGQGAPEAPRSPGAAPPSTLDRVMEAAKAAETRSPAQVISVHLDGPEAVDLRFVHRNGETQMSVQASSPEMTQRLRADLPELQQWLGNRGLQFDSDAQERNPQHRAFDPEDQQQQRQRPRRDQQQGDGND